MRTAQDALEVLDRYYAECLFYRLSASPVSFFFFFFNDPAPTEISPLPLRAALRICLAPPGPACRAHALHCAPARPAAAAHAPESALARARDTAFSRPGTAPGFLTSPAWSTGPPQSFFARAPRTACAWTAFVFFPGVRNDVFPMAAGRRTCAASRRHGRPGPGRTRIGRAHV